MFDGRGSGLLHVEVRISRNVEFTVREGFKQIVDISSGILRREDIVILSSEPESPGKEEFVRILRIGVESRIGRGDVESVLLLFSCIELFRKFRREVSRCVLKCRQTLQMIPFISLLFFQVNGRSLSDGCVDVKFRNVERGGKSDVFNRCVESGPVVRRFVRVGEHCILRIRKEDSVTCA